jgi:hypothetical protein
MSGQPCCQVRFLVGTTVVLDEAFCAMTLHPVRRRELETRLLLWAAAASMGGLSWRVLWADLRDGSARPLSESGNPLGLPVQREQVTLAVGAALRLMGVDRPWLRRLLTDRWEVPA